MNSTFVVAKDGPFGTPFPNPKTPENVYVGHLLLTFLGNEAQKFSGGQRRVLGWGPNNACTFFRP